ncbi:ATP-binding protein [Acetonema longum]|uniref:Kinase-like protein n=1 Tax=Acetonema longum DSM 6540 TaxID=1009370 RepID=F7NK93_9FIRM|nr:ATP-binding protein [Acetonema longum]EGO63534.1 kinase-like protein [Acetonema longum DSM 6540]
MDRVGLEPGNLVITVGLPLSGKSILARRCAESGPKIVVVCPDTIRLALHGSQFVGSAEPFVWAIAQTMVRTLLKEGYTVIVDATNTTVERRRIWVQMSKEFGKRVAIYHVDTDYATCCARNQRHGRLDSAIIDRMHRQFEPPAKAEGDIFTAAQVEKYLDESTDDCDVTDR